MAKRLSTIFLECLMFIGLVCMISHLTTSIWERHLIQHELSNVKSSLFLLKHKVSYIGQAYDELHQELNELATFTDVEKSYSTKDADTEIKNNDIPGIIAPPLANSEIQVQRAVENNFASAHILASNRYKSASKEDKDLIFQNEIAKREAYKNVTSTGSSPLVKDKFTQAAKNRRTHTCKSQSTLTRYPPKSVGVFVGESLKYVKATSPRKSGSAHMRYSSRAVDVCADR